MVTSTARFPSHYRLDSRSERSFCLRLRKRHNYPVMADLLESPAFRGNYELEPHQLPDGKWLNLYRLQDSSDRTFRPN